MDASIETRIDDWRAHLVAHPAVSSDDVAELETHLRDQLDVLVSGGLAPDEALIVAVKRMGALDEVAAEYAREHSDRLWKQLVVGRATGRESGTSGLPLAIGLALAAAAAVKVPALWGVTLYSPFFLRNGVLLVLPFLAAYFLVRRRAGWSTVVAVAVPFAVFALVLNLYPFADSGGGGLGQTGLLAIVHSAVVLWLAVGVAHAARNWRSGRARMDFVRFSGEWFVYYVLIALGGFALMALTDGIFGAVGLNVTAVVADWMLPCGATGAVLIAAWLVEAKKNVIENIVPVLTKVFSPLMTLLLVAAVIATLVQFDFIDDGRDLLIVFNLVLLVVLGLVLYALSARDPDAAPSWSDRLQLVLLVAALAVDLIVLIAMIGRIGTYGASANKLASLGLNLILLVNLAGAAWLQLSFVRDRTRLAALERWQTSYLPVYATWAAVVAIVFPPVFSFV
ncbi:permease prefix domain 1-containing protein [Rathayibacter sp. CAU 1779]